MGCCDLLIRFIGFWTTHAGIFFPQFAPDDEYIFCGTTSGDILKIHTKTKYLSDYGPIKTKHSLVSRPGSIPLWVSFFTWGFFVVFHAQGANVLKALSTGELLVGSGFGTLTLCSSTTFKALKWVHSIIHQNIILFLQVVCHTSVSPDFIEKKAHIWQKTLPD